MCSYRNNLRCNVKRCGNSTTTPNNNNSTCDAITKSGSTHLAPLSSNIPFYRYRCQHPPVTTAGVGRQVPADAAARQSPGTAAATTRRAPTVNYRPIDTCKAQPYSVVPI